MFFSFFFFFASTKPRCNRREDHWNRNRHTSAVSTHFGSAGNILQDVSHKRLHTSHNSSAERRSSGRTAPYTWQILHRVTQYQWASIDWNKPTHEFVGNSSEGMLSNDDTNWCWHLVKQINQTQIDMTHIVLEENSWDNLHQIDLSDLDLWQFIMGLFEYLHLYFTLIC